MKIVFLTTGSRGDVQPFVALAKALSVRGAEVFIAATEDSRELAMRNGLNYIGVRGNIAELIRSGGVQEAVRADNIFKFIRALSNKELKKALLDITEDLYHACEGMDLIIYHPGAAIGAFAGEDLGIPAYAGSPFPFTPAAEYPALLFYNPKPPRFFNRVSHVLFTKGLFFTSKAAVRGVYKERLEASRKRFPNPLTSPEPKLISCSDAVFPVSRPSVSRGWWFLDEAEYTPPPGLVDFLEKGDKPPVGGKAVYIGFGSVGTITEVKETTEIFAAALERTNSRAVIASASGAFAGGEEVPSNIYLLKEAPHGWLFPRVSAVIHHGGAGTSAAGFRAGVPSIIIPHGNDQFAWARRAYELGIGVKPIPFGNMTVDAVTSALEAARDPGIIKRARDFGEKIRADRGAEETARYILEQLYG